MSKVRLVQNVELFECNDAMPPTEMNLTYVLCLSPSHFPGGVLELADEMRDLQIVKDDPIPTITAKHSQQVSNILKQLKASNGPQLNDLQYKNLTTSGLNYTGLLREIADEQKFEVTYISAETVEGRATCLCHLTTLPLAVCFGIGETEELAKMNASHNALQYLKIMTRKK